MVERRTNVRRTCINIGCIPTKAPDPNQRRPRGCRASADRRPAAGLPRGRRLEDRALSACSARQELPQPGRQPSSTSTRARALSPETVEGEDRRRHAGDRRKHIVINTGPKRRFRPSRASPKSRRVYTSTSIGAGTPAFQTIVVAAVISDWNSPRCTPRSVPGSQVARRFRN